MVIKNIANAYTVLKIFAEASNAMLYSMGSQFDKSTQFNDCLKETISRLQDALDNIEVE